jgi:dTDP-4-amino-4,6-dideoxygalactose transaminase
MNLKYPYAKHKLTHQDFRFAAKAMKSGVLTRGKFTQKLEEKLCLITGARFAVTVSSGTAALHCAYLALEKPVGTRLFSSPITFASAITSGYLSGYHPFFVDIEPDKPQISVNELTKHIHSNSIIVPTAMCGQSYEQTQVWTLAQKHQCDVIADHSHSLGGKIWNNQKALSMANAEFSTMSVLSFQATKIITGGGEGGAILTNNEHLYKRLKAIRSHGMIYDSSDLERKNEGAHYHEMQFPGLNYRITEMQAALCLSQLSRLDELIAKRNEIADWYIKLLKESDSIQLPYISDYLPAWHLFAVQIKNRNNVAATLRKKGIGTQVHYLPVYKHPWYQKNGITTGTSCLNAEKYYAETLSLPVYDGLHKRDVQFIAETLKSALAKS